MTATTRTTWPRVIAFGDAAVLVDLDRPPALETSRLVHDLARYLSNHLTDLASSQPGWEPPVPGAGTIVVPVDPVDPGVAAAIERLQALVARWSPPGPGTSGDPDHEPPIIEIPVRYGGDGGPDLAEVARQAGLEPGQVIAAHARGEYTVTFLGFAPGFAYLGPLAPELVLPRQPVPRTRVPAGSVAIGGPQTAVYPIDGPGGWWLIGWTPLVLWDATGNPPAILQPGSRVRFRPLAEA